MVIKSFEDTHHWGMVPFSSVREGSNASFPSQLYYKESESDLSRWAHLLKIFEKDVPYSIHSGSAMAPYLANVSPLNIMIIGC